MPDFTVKTSGDASDARLHMDGAELRHVRRFSFDLEAGFPARVDVEYAGQAFDLEAINAHLVCRGTGLSEIEERAVLAYMQDKYRE